MTHKSTAAQKIASGHPAYDFRFFVANPVPDAEWRVATALRCLTSARGRRNVTDIALCKRDLASANRNLLAAHYYVRELV